MVLRRCAAAAFGLLVLAPGLAACGDDAGVEVGDVVAARDDAQFSDGSPSSVVLPRGRLEISLGEPTDDLSADDTRQLEAITAPAGSTFVPLTWQYDAATFNDYADFLTTESTPAITLVADGASYRLPAPRETGEGSASFYVLVSGSAKEPSLAVDFDGVKQTVDLTTGERDAGLAEPLYDLKPPKDKARACTKDATFAEKVVVADFACSVRRVVRLPYAGSAWAEPDHTWLGVTIRTSLGRYAVSSDARSGAVYYPLEVKPTFTLGKIKSAAVIEDTASRSCPDLTQGGCTTVYNVVFDLAEGASTRLDATFTYDMTQTTIYGGADAAEEITADIEVRTKVR